MRSSVILADDVEADITQRRSAHCLSLVRSRWVTPGLIHDVSEIFDAGATSSTSMDSTTVAMLPMVAVRHARTFRAAR